VLKNKKVKLIYIVGFGYSGTTLLSRVLGTSSNCFTIGELYHLNSVLAGERVGICDSGGNIQESVFWRESLRNINIKKLLPEKMTKWEKYIFFLSILFFRDHKLKRDINIKEEEKFYSNIFNQARKTKGARVECLVESSKSLKRLVGLSFSKKIDLKIINIVRDGRGIAGSFYKKKERDIFSGYFHWFLVNWSIKKFLKCPRLRRENILELSYDIFSQNPEKFIKIINEKFNVCVSPLHVVENINKEKFQAFCGNPMRRKKMKNIFYDQKWKVVLPVHLKIVANIISYVPNKFWVYDKKLNSE